MDGVMLRLLLLLQGPSREAWRGTRMTCLGTSGSELMASFSTVT